MQSTGQGATPASGFLVEGAGSPSTGRLAVAQIDSYVAFRKAQLAALQAAQLASQAGPPARARPGGDARVRRVEPPGASTPRLQAAYWALHEDPRYGEAVAYD